MPKEQRGSYLEGMIDMLTYQASISGNKTKADCIIDTYYRGEIENAWNRLLDAFEALPDRHPAGIVAVLVKRECGE